MVSLKAGRSNASDKIDYAVGISQVVQLNDYVEQGQTMIAMAHVQTMEQWQMLNEKLSQLLIIEDKKGPPQALVKEVFQAQ